MLRGDLMEVNHCMISFLLSGLLFGILCTSMAVVASFMGSVVQVMEEGNDI